MRTSCCSPAVRTCRRCRHAASASRALKATSKSGRRSPATSPRSGLPTSCFSASKPTVSQHSRRHFLHSSVPTPSVVSTQNGIPWWYFQGHGGEFEGWRLERIDPGGVIAAAIEPRRVVGSLAYFATDVIEPGVIRHNEGNRISFGEPDGSRSDRVRRIAEALIAAGFRCPVSTRFRHEIWVKLLGNISFNPVSALTRGTLEEMVRQPDTARLIRDVMTEAELVAKRLGIEIPISIDQRMAGGEKAGAHKTSMLQDLEAGRPMEIEAIAGATLELGERLGVPMPATRAVYACVKLLDERRERSRTTGTIGN